MKRIIYFLLILFVASQSFAQPKLAKATFAGGCFWCMVPPFEKLHGVVSVTSGYAGGEKKNPTYEEVSSGVTGHAESVQVIYDPAKITYSKLLEVYWHNVDPFVKDRQFCDTGNQYRTVIFYHDATQKKLALETKAQIEKMGKGEVFTQIVPYTIFYPAEEYHQDYYKKNPVEYNLYRTGCRRDARLQELWGTSSH
jgi:peptide-methionine (S)-S-oxide reductase